MLSIDRIQEQARDNGWDSETELIRLLAHGCVHLVGYDHEQSPEDEQQMLSLETELLELAGLPFIYQST